MENNEINPKKLSVLASPDKRVAKLCNFVTFSKLGDGSILLSFLFVEPQIASEAEEIKESESVLIERVVVDIEHARKIIKTLDDLINTDNIPDALGESNNV